MTLLRRLTALPLRPMMTVGRPGVVAGAVHRVAPATRMILAHLAQIPAAPAVLTLVRAAGETGNG